MIRVGTGPGLVLIGVPIRSATVLNDRTVFLLNEVILYGTLPVVTGVAAFPPVFNPVLGVEQKLTFLLATNENQNAKKVDAFFINQACLDLAAPENCLLRSIFKTDVSPGLVQIKWDGRADNGMFVAPGYYAVMIRVEDAIGNVVTSQLMTTIQY